MLPGQAIVAASDAGWIVLVPGDPNQLTGGYGYVRDIVSGLTELGQAVTLQGLPGQFPKVDQSARAALDATLAEQPDGATVIIDGLALGGCPEAAEGHCDRLRLVALVHHPLADETGLSEADRQHFLNTERRVLAAVHRVITTSDMTARGLERFGVAPTKVAVVTPGVHRPVTAGEVGTATDAGLRILCLAHLSPRKAQHQLVEALSRLPVSDWHCELVGSTERDADYAATVLSGIRDLGLSERVRVAGELSGPELATAFRRATLFVLPSLYEGYGMVVDEALAHGLPVITSDGGALAETAARPGCVTYPAGGVDALAGLLADRLEHPDRLARQREEALASAGNLKSWDQAAREFREAVAGGLPAGSDFDARWLALRQPADHSARSGVLTDELAGWLRDRSKPEIADLGAGTGSNWRYLSRAFEARSLQPGHWHLFEQDASLLAGLDAPAPGPTLHVQRLEADNLDRLLPDPLDLLTASALIDLVSRPWLEAMAEAAARRRAAVLIVLSYAGDFRLTPDHERDEDLRQLVNLHQHGNKGTGAACGPDASDYLARALDSHGYVIHRDSSPWRLDHGSRELQHGLMQGWVEAARAQLAVGRGSANDASWLDRWLAERQGQADEGRLTIEVSHIDLLGLPVV